MRLDRGVIFLSPALGSDGRIFVGNPADRTDNLVAVRFPEAGDGQVDADLFLAAGLPFSWFWNRRARAYS
jgi:hypothetical protein